MKKKNYLFIILCIALVCLTIGCGKKDVTKESYGTFTYQAEGNQESIQIDKDTLKLSVDLEYLRNAKAGLELGKKKKELEQENKTMTEKETSDYLEECRKNIDLSGFDNVEVAYTSEYAEDSQQIYLTTEEKNGQCISLNYDLKFQTLTFYSKEFSKGE